MKASEYFEHHNHLVWLQDIAKDYREQIDLMEREGDSFVIYAILYSARDDGRSMKINPHRPIDPRFILDGLRDALHAVENEIADLKEKLNKVFVEL